MTKEHKKKVYNEILYDIGIGVYDSFPKLKDKLNFISKKLNESIIVLNSSKELSKNEIKILNELGYIIE